MSYENDPRLEIPSKIGEPIQELVTERELWREERDTPEWKEVHDKADDLRQHLLDKVLPEAKEKGDPLALRTYTAAGDLATAVCVLLEEPDLIVAPSRNVGIGPELDAGDARWFLGSTIINALEQLGYPVDRFRDDVKRVTLQDEIEQNQE